MLLRQMFQFGLVRELIASDPTVGIRKKDLAALAFAADMMRNEHYIAIGKATA